MYSGNDFLKNILVYFFFQSLDSRLVVYSCDFFKMKVDVLEHGKCDAVYDRGAFEAIYESDRQAYVRTILALLTSDFRYILNVYEYEDEVYNMLRHVFWQISKHLKDSTTFDYGLQTL